MYDVAHLFADGAADKFVVDKIMSVPRTQERMVKEVSFNRNFDRNIALYAKTRFGGFGEIKDTP